MNLYNYNKKLYPLTFLKEVGPLIGEGRTTKDNQRQPKKKIIIGALKGASLIMARKRKCNASTEPNQLNENRGIRKDKKMKKLNRTEIKKNILASKEIHRLDRLRPEFVEMGTEEQLEFIHFQNTDGLKTMDITTLDDYRYLQLDYYCSYIHQSVIQEPRPPATYKDWIQAVEIMNREQQTSEPHEIEDVLNHHSEVVSNCPYPELLI